MGVAVGIDVAKESTGPGPLTRRERGAATPASLGSLLVLAADSRLPRAVDRHQAVIALARRRVDVLHAMLRNRQPYEVRSAKAA
jgi:hypothetical protein